MQAVSYKKKVGIYMEGKKQISVALVVLLFLSPYFVFAGSEIPSQWAQEDVKEAIKHSVVHHILRGNYQTSIKRYEYVLLALNVLDKKNKSIPIIKKHPFSDILGHDYEDEIVRAYNAGLIKGYSDGTFQPEKLITRQEIALLVVNLVSAIDPSKDMTVSKNFEYGDSTNISSWALNSINYCFENEILKGVGKNYAGLDVINPHGHASIEQAIVLLYRLSQKEQLIQQKDFGTVVVTAYLEDKKIDVETDIINQFAVVFGENMTEVIISLSQDKDIEINDISDNFISMGINKAGMINMVQSDHLISINGSTVDLDHSKFIEAFSAMVEVLDDSEEIEKMLEKSINGLEKENDFQLKEETEKGGTFKAFSEKIQDTDDSEMTIFAFSFRHKKLTKEDEQ